MDRHIDRRSLLLLLLGTDPEGRVADGINGITRIQKFLFILSRETSVREIDETYSFQAYKAGPYSPSIYDDLEFLENMGLLQGETVGEASEEEADDVEVLSFEDLIGDSGDQGGRAADAYEERRFTLTKAGRRKVEELLQNPDFAPVVDAIRTVKSKYGRYSLSDLMYYVYTKYPEMTTQSEIKEQVLRRNLTLKKKY